MNGCLFAYLNHWSGAFRGDWFELRGCDDESDSTVRAACGGTVLGACCWRAESSGCCKGDVCEVLRGSGALIVAICVQADSSGVLSVVSPQPADVSSCAYVLQTAGEFLNNPLAIGVADGTQIGWGILMVWSAAWVGRMLIRALSVGDGAENDQA